MDNLKKNDRNIITVLLHDYFHRGIFKEYIGEKQWSRFESRLDKNVDDVLELFEPYNIKATFFTLGWIAEKQPEIVKRIAEQGHEIASAGFWARSVHEMTSDTFREDIRRSKNVLEQACGYEVLGYRCAYKWISKKDSWALEILSEEGYKYDASIKPSLWGIYNDNSYSRELHLRAGKMWEFPVSTINVLGINLPISGGGYLRLLPRRVIDYGFNSWARKNKAPFVVYFHPWELDKEIPIVTALGPLSKIKQYKNIGRIQSILWWYFNQTDFISIRSFLDLRPKSVKSTPPKDIIPTVFDEVKPKCLSGKPHKKVSVVIPCYNEEKSLLYLKKSLEELSDNARELYDFNFIFVDDCSSDDTYNQLHIQFKNSLPYKVIRHNENKGIAASIMTGIQNSDSEIICSIDADCSYDPTELINMIPLLINNVDMVTASPYHKNGFVLGVPNWRLFLSRSLSVIYNLILNHQFATYTSCFRVYRKKSLIGLKLHHGDFKGILEQLVYLEIAGGNIVEYPTTLQSRIFGFSSMKILKTIIGHLQFLFSLLFRKVFSK